MVSKTTWWKSKVINTSKLDLYKTWFSCQVNAIDFATASMFLVFRIIYYNLSRIKKPSSTCVLTFDTTITFRFYYQIAKTKKTIPEIRITRGRLQMIQNNDTFSLSDGKTRWKKLLFFFFFGSYRFEGVSLHNDDVFRNNCLNIRNMNFFLLSFWAF